ncbi:unnamed protein product, partial [Closterium sp. Naga37s-1]
MPHGNWPLNGSLCSESLTAILLIGTNLNHASNWLAPRGITSPCRLFGVLPLLVVTAQFLSLIAVANATVPTCASLAAQAPSLNLLRNAGFEEASIAADWPSPLSAWVPLVPGAAAQQGQVAGVVQGEGGGGGELPPGDLSVAAEGGRFVRLQPSDGCGGTGGELWGSGASEREGAVWPVQGLGQLLCIAEGGEQQQQQQGEFSLYFYARARECVMDMLPVSGLRPMRAMIVAVPLSTTAGSTGSSVDEAELARALAGAMSSGAADMMVLHEWTVGVPCRNNSYSLSGLMPWRQHGPYSFHLPPSPASAAALSFPAQGVALHLVLLEGSAADSSSTPSAATVELPVLAPLPPIVPGGASVASAAAVEGGELTSAAAAAGNIDVDLITVAPRGTGHASVHPAGIPSLAANQTLHAWVAYNATASLLSVLLSSSPAMPPSALLSLPFNACDLFHSASENGGEGEAVLVQVGFAAGTGLLPLHTQTHDILSWSFQVDTQGERGSGRQAEGQLRGEVCSCTLSWAFHVDNHSEWKEAEVGWGKWGKGWCGVSRVICSPTHSLGVSEVVCGSPLLLPDPSAHLPPPPSLQPYSLHYFFPSSLSFPLCSLRPSFFPPNSSTPLPPLPAPAPLPLWQQPSLSFPFLTQGARFTAWGSTRHTFSSLQLTPGNDEEETGAAFFPLPLPLLSLLPPPPPRKGKNGGKSDALVCKARSFTSWFAFDLDGRMTNGFGVVFVLSTQPGLGQGGTDMGYGRDAQGRDANGTWADGGRSVAVMFDAFSGLDPNHDVNKDVAILSVLTDFNVTQRLNSSSQKRYSSSSLLYSMRVDYTAATKTLEAVTYNGAQRRGGVKLTLDLCSVFYDGNSSIAGVIPVFAGFSSASTLASVQAIKAWTFRFTDVNPCTAWDVNPCGAGRCTAVRSAATGTYSSTCSCPLSQPSYKLPQMPAFQTCHNVSNSAARVPFFPAPPGLTCPLLLDIFDLSPQELLESNKGMACEKPISRGLIVNVSASANKSCSSMYSTNQGDTCMSIDSLLATNITHLNPHVCGEQHQVAHLPRGGVHGAQGSRVGPAHVPAGRHVRQRAGAHGLLQDLPHQRRSLLRPPAARCCWLGRLCSQH